MVYCIPTFFELRIDSQGRLQQTEFRKSSAYKFWYKANLNLLIIFVVPSLILIVLNFVIIRSIRRAIFLRQEILAFSRRIRNRNFNEERRLSIIAVLVCTTLLISNILSCMNNYIQETEGHPSNPTDQYYVVKRTFIFTGNALVCLNSATNFMIYCALGRKYRKQFLKLLSRRRGTTTVNNNNFLYMLLPLRDRPLPNCAITDTTCKRNLRMTLPRQDKITL